MRVKPLRSDLERYLAKRNLLKKFHKQLTIFKKNPKHPSLHTEVLEPKKLRIYSFRINQKYRTIFIMSSPNEAEIIDINDHYQ